MYYRLIYLKFALVLIVSFQPPWNAGHISRFYQAIVHRDIGKVKSSVLIS